MDQSGATFFSNACKTAPITLLMIWWRAQTVLFIALALIGAGTI
jgi:hypothetical protein